MVSGGAMSSVLREMICRQNWARKAVILARTALFHETFVEQTYSGVFIVVVVHRKSLDWPS